MFKKLFSWLQDKLSKKSKNLQSSSTHSNQSQETIQQTCHEINAMIEFIEAYEKDNAENLKKEKEIAARILSKKD